MNLDSKQETDETIHNIMAAIVKSVDLEKKAGFRDSQHRNSDGTWGDDGSLGVEKYPGDPRAKKCFNQWFEGSKMTDSYGDPKRYFHGTTHEFEEFKKGRGNIENDFGIGHYFTSGLDDAETNYRAEGPDLRNRIERLSEQIEYDQSVFEDQATAIARKRLRGGVQKVIPVYLNLKNPMVLGGPNETQFQYEFDYETGEETGNMINFVENLRHAASGYNDVEIDRVVGDAFSSLEMGGGSTNIFKAIRSSEGLMYASDDNGNLASNEILRSAVQAAGFDGIVDNNVSDKFRNMSGLRPNTQHVIAFEPGQVKGADNETYCDDVNFTKEAISIAEYVNKMRQIKAGFDPRQQRNPDGTWGGGGGSGLNPTKIDIKEQVRSHKEGGGSTFTQEGKNMVGAKGMGAVSLWPEHSLILDGQLTEEMLLKYIQDKKDFLSLSPEYSIGSWYDSGSNKIYLDVSQVMKLEDAIRFGRRNNQKAIFNLETMEEILTGGTGETGEKAAPGVNMNTPENWKRYGDYVKRTHDGSIKED